MEKKQESDYKVSWFPIFTFVAAALIFTAAVLCYPLPGRKVQSSAGSAFVSGLAINLNEADAQTLCLLPGVGEKRAADIIAYREANGEFADWEELLQIPGIGEKTIESWQQYVVFD